MSFDFSGLEQPKTKGERSREDFVNFFIVLAY